MNGRTTQSSHVNGVGGKVWPCTCLLDFACGAFSFASLIASRRSAAMIPEPARAARVGVAIEPPRLFVETCDCVALAWLWMSDEAPDSNILRSKLRSMTGGSCDNSH